MAMRKFRGGAAIGLNEGQISHTMRNFAHPAKPQEEAKEFRTPCEIFLCTDSVRFLSPDILCNFLFSPCNQPRYFLFIFFLYLLVTSLVDKETHRWMEFIEHL